MIQYDYMYMQHYMCMCYTSCIPEDDVTTGIGGGGMPVGGNIIPLVVLGGGGMPMGK